ncbi:hypothetical protein MHU86_13449 [Fragilaria crotonensis]|nr:hypothetical protein MHU86_13449 [Fragilaria crotonensis]
MQQTNFDDALDKISRLFTLPTIDTVAENYRSKTFNIYLWVLVVVAFFAYAFEFRTKLGQQDCPTSFMSEFGCRVANSIIAWMMIMLQLIVLGTIFVVLSTAGNSIYLQHDLPGFFSVVVGIASITISCILSYIYSVKFFLINTYKAPDYQYQFVYGFALALGCFLLLFQIKALLYVLVPRSMWKKLPFSNFWLTCEMAKSECCSKQAAAFKINSMVDHALEQHSGTCLERAEKSETASLKLRGTSLNSSHAKAMMHFQATADHREPVGGVLDTFRKMWNGSLFKEDGVYIHAGLYSMNVAQWFIVIFYIILYASIDLLIQAIYNPETQAPSVSPSPTTPSPTMSPVDIEALVATNPEILQSVASLQQQETLAILQRLWRKPWPMGLLQIPPLPLDTSLSSTSNTDTFRKRLCDSSDPDWFPTEAEVRFAGSVGCVVAFLAAASLALVWIPSSVSTILQFRCGHIGSLRCRSFLNIAWRLTLPPSCLVQPSGDLYCALSILIIVGLVTFALVWSVTRTYVMILLANVIGILVTLVFTPSSFVRRILFVGFFRKRPIEVIS